MGCRAARSTYSEENEYLFKQETALGFSTHPPSVIEATCYRLAQNGQMTDAAFLRFRDTLQLVKDPEVGYCCFEKFRDLEGLYDAKMLLVFGLMLSRGTVPEKALALWNAFMPDGSTEISAERCESMLDSLLRASLDYSLEVSIVQPALPEDRLSAWRDSMGPKKSKALHELKDMFLGKKDSLKQATFLRLVSEESSADVTTTASLRAIVEKMKAMPSKFANAFPKNQFASKLV